MQIVSQFLFCRVIETHGKLPVPPRITNFEFSGTMLQVCTEVIKDRAIESINFRRTTPETVLKSKRIDRSPNPSHIVQAMPVFAPRNPRRTRAMGPEDRLNLYDVSRGWKVIDRVEKATEDKDLFCLSRIFG